MVMKKNTILFIAFILLLAAQNALAMPPGGPATITKETFFALGDGTVRVNSGAYLINSGIYEGKYAYTYQITNINSSVGISFFSVGINAGVVLDYWDFDAGTINPAIWSPVADSLTVPVVAAQSFDALFNRPLIKSGDTSAILWFVSGNIPGFSQGALFGTSSGVPQYKTGQLIAPVPEPATISLLTFGGILAALARRRNRV